MIGNVEIILKCWDGTELVAGSIEQLNVLTNRQCDCGSTEFHEVRITGVLNPKVISTLRVRQMMGTIYKAQCDRCKKILEIQ